MNRASLSGCCDWLYSWHTLQMAESVQLTQMNNLPHIFGSGCSRTSPWSPTMKSCWRWEERASVAVSHPKKGARNGFLLTTMPVQFVPLTLQFKSPRLPNVCEYQPHPQFTPFKHARTPRAHTHTELLLAFRILCRKSSESLWKSPPSEIWVGSVGSSRPLLVNRGCSPQHLSRLASHSALPLCHQLHVRARPGRSVRPRGRSRLKCYRLVGFVWKWSAGGEWRGCGVETFMPKCGWLPQVSHSAGTSSRLGERTSGGGRNHPAPYYPLANTQSEVAPEWQLPGLMQLDV